ncbi:MAG: adenine deaminase, partial [Oscillospiraceae bacterium]|nr:adenine deaminase [Oscillospiraceae bacterium]
MTREIFVTMKPTEGQIKSDPAHDILKAVVFERHKATGSRGIGFVKGFGIKRGAMASTVAHDAHNLLVIGTCDEDMALAANTLIACGGGMCAVCDGIVTATVPLPIAGLMNDKSAAEMSELVGRLDSAWKDIGCTLPSPYMTMAIVPLACIPELRLTNRGIVDCRSYEFADLFAD